MYIGDLSPLETSTIRLPTSHVATSQSQERERLQKQPPERGGETSRRRSNLVSSDLTRTMAMASTFHQTFLTGNPLLSLNKHPLKKSPHRGVQLLSCHSSMQKDEEPEPNRNANELQLAKLALVAVAAGVLTLGSPQDAMAAKSGGRVGGQAFRSSAPRSSGPRINNSRTNVFINPPVAPPLVGGYGYGVYGGWGWSPFTFFAPGPTVAVGIGGGFDFVAAILIFGVIAAVVRRFTARRDYDDEDDF